MRLWIETIVKKHIDCKKNTRIEFTYKTNYDKSKAALCLLRALVCLLRALVECISDMNMLSENIHFILPNKILIAKILTVGLGV